MSVAPDSLGKKGLVNTKSSTTVRVSPRRLYIDQLWPYFGGSWVSKGDAEGTRMGSKA